MIAQDGKSFHHNGVLALLYVDAMVAVVVQRTNRSKTFLEIQLHIRTGSILINFLPVRIRVARSFHVAIVVCFPLIGATFAVAEYQHGFRQPADFHFLCRACTKTIYGLADGISVYRVCHNGGCVCAA